AATSDSYPLSLHDALPISNEYPESLTLQYPAGHPPFPGQDGSQSVCPRESLPKRLSSCFFHRAVTRSCRCCQQRRKPELPRQPRSEEHTSELQSPDHLVCR